MGETGDRPRKRRERMPKVPRGAEASNIHLAGLTSGGSDPQGNRLDHEASSGRSEDIGRVQQFLLRCLGRYPKKDETPQET